MAVDSALLAEIADGAADRERAGALEPDLVARMTQAGMFSVLVPAALGGGEAEPAALVALVESIAAADGAVGWCAGVGATAGLAAAYLPEGEAAELFGSPPAVAAGVFAPRGRLEPAGDGSFRLSGRWPLASGVLHAEVVGLGAVDPERGARYAVVPREAVAIVETWDALGLRATGSHDVTVEGLEVPGDRIVDLAGGDPVATGSLYAFPLFGLLALSVSAVCTGIALGALAEARGVAAGRTPLGSRRALAERGTAQESVAAAEAALRAARAGVDAAIAAAWRKAESGDPLGPGERLGLRLAATHAARTAVDVVDAAHRMSGSGGLYAGVAERRLRDVHTAAQHMIVAPATFELAGRILLGVRDDDPGL